MKSFERLGAWIEERWRASDFDEAAFPAIAADALEREAPWREVGASDVIDWLIDTRRLPHQGDLDARFGEPPITVYASDRFHVEVLFWVDGTTSIHQHAFSGAFTVLEGSSLHASYSFREEGRWSEHLRRGALAFEDVELLAPGDVRRIEAGSTMIHSVFHLDRPTASIVVRTNHEASSGPQLAYLKPGLAVHTFFATPRIRRLQQTFKMLAAVKSDRLEALAIRALQGADALEAYHVLASNVRHLPEESFERVLDALGAERPDLVKIFRPALHETHRELALISRRERVTSADHRFFLALLLNVPSKTRILDLVRAYRPESDPIDTVIAWLAELARADETGESPLLLELDDLGLTIARAMLRGGSFDGMLRELEDEYDAADIVEMRDTLRAIFDALQSSMTLRPLFQDDAREAAEAEPIAASA